MPITALDPLSALVVIDLQEGLAGFPLLHPFADIVARSAELADAFRRAKLPVVLVNVVASPDGGDVLALRSERAHSLPTDPAFATIVPGMRQAPSDLVITKRQWGAFHGTELDLQLRRRGVTGIVMTGVATSIGVDSTARGAQERGYNLTFASDAMTDMLQSAHDHSLGHIFPMLGEVGTTADVLAKLTAR